MTDTSLRLAAESSAPSARRLADHQRVLAEIGHHRLLKAWLQCVPSRRHKSDIYKPQIVLAVAVLEIQQKDDEEQSDDERESIWSKLKRSGRDHWPSKQIELE